MEISRIFNGYPIRKSWAVAYLLSGVISTLCSDPATGLPIVWLPAGLATAAFLLNPGSSGRGLLVTFLCVQFLLEVIVSRQPASALIFALAGGISSFLAAWAIRRSGAVEDDPGAIVALLSGATLGAAANASLKGGWLWWVHAQGTFPWLEIFWGNLAGILVVAPMLTCWSRFRARRSGGMRLPDFLRGMALHLTLVVSAILVFDDGLLRQHPYVLSFQLAYLPIAAAMLIPLAWGRPGGTLGVMTLALIIMYKSALVTGLAAEGHDSLQLWSAAQVYLVVAAVVVQLVSTLRSARVQDLETGARWRGFCRMALAGSNQVMYHYNPADRRLELMGEVHTAFGVAVDAINDLDSLVAMTHPEDRARLARYWAARLSGAKDSSVMLFRIAHAAGGWRMVIDRGEPLLDFDNDVIAIAGTWALGEVDAGLVEQRGPMNG